MLLATHLDVVFDKFLSQIDDIELGLLEYDDLEYLLIDYLENAIIEFKECKKNLALTKPLRETYRFDEGVHLYVEVKLDEDSTVVVRDSYAEYEENKDYILTYDKYLEELLIELLVQPTGSVEVEIKQKGFIEADLTLEEVYILSLSMRLFWLSPKINREENLRQMMNDRDYKQLSNANMLKALLSLHTNTRQELQKFKQRYAFNDFKGFD